MHLLQRRHRRDLQRRIANGEVNLEALGIKRLNVPPDVLEKMPRYVYTSKEGVPEPTDNPKEAATEEPSAEATTNPTEEEVVARAALPKREVPFSQPTCSICLDDFEHNQTIVRELPCSHIFHPECIDGFLKDNSSLCPMCKKSALPQGYCVTDVTNAMVRRERLIRRMRERVTIVMEDGTSVQPPPRGAQPSLHYRYASLQRRFARPSRRRRASDAALRASTAPGATVAPGTITVPASTELMTMPASAEPVITPDAQPPPEIQRAGTFARREWGRNRLRSAMLQSRTPADDAREMERRLPKCKSNPTFSRSLARS